MEDFLKELQEAIEEDEKKQYELSGDIETDKQVIDSDSMANFFIKMIKQNEEEIDAINKYVDDELEKIRIRYDNHRNERIDSIQKQNNYYKALLESYTYKQLENSKRKSIKLPYGTLQIRKQQPTIEYDETTLEWLKQNIPEYIKTKTVESIDKTKLKKDCFINSSDNMYINEIQIPGVVITQRPDKFEVK